MRVKHLVVSALTVSLVTALASANPPPADTSHPHVSLDVALVQTLSTEGYAPQYQHLGITGRAAAGPVLLLGELHLQNDDRYTEGHRGGYWLGANGTLGQGGVVLDLPPLTMRAGRFYHSDQVASPYSLFVSSSRIGALQLAIDIETPRLFFSTRAIELNRDSARGYPDRGAAIRAYGVKIGTLRVGFQDVIVYADRAFDLEYFLNPIPGFLLQYLKRSPGTPWAAGFNHNSIMGFFVDRHGPASYQYAQILIDDINANRFVRRDLVWNPDKIAWSIGGSYDFAFGTLGFYHAGATRYTFQAFGGGGTGTATDTKYGYTYVPDVEYTVDGEPRVIRLEDNYVGYLHGENNLAFMVTYDRILSSAGPIPIALSSSVELTVSGSKSPANPWHELNWYLEAGEGTRLLDDDRLETRALARAGAVAAPRGPWRVFGDVSLGYVRNELELVDVPPELAGANNEIRFFAPGTTQRPFGSLRVGASYRF